MHFPKISVSFPLTLLTAAFFLLGPGPVYAGQNFERRTPLVIAVEKVGPAVVNIFTEESAPAVRNPFRNFGGSPFDRFFDNFFPPTNSRRRSLGSGVIINRDGYILTNEHVVAKAVRIKVTLIDKREYRAKLIGADIKSDLAIIKIDSKEPLPFVEMGCSDDLMIGESVLAIGNPFGLSHTVTTGIISAINRTIRPDKRRVYQDFIQVDASINPGNSGGPLLNINGSLIGINTAIYQEAEGIGFAIPIDNARRIVNELIRFGKVRRGWIGISVQDMTPEILEFFKMDKQQGILVVRIIKDSPAERAGLKAGDIVLSLDRPPINKKVDYRERVSTYPIGNTIRFDVLRDGKAAVARVRVSSIPEEKISEFTRDWIGLAARKIDSSLKRKFGIDTEKGMVVVEVVANSPSGKIGIRPGDVIRQINRTTIDHDKDFREAIVEAGSRDSVLLLVQRGRYGYYVTLEP